MHPRRVQLFTPILITLTILTSLFILFFPSQAQKPATSETTTGSGLVITPTNKLTLTEIGAYAGGVGSEIPAYDPETQRIFVSVGEDIGSGDPVGLVDILDASDPYSPTLFATLDISATQGAVPNSVAFHDGVLAVAGENALDPQANGWVLFYDADGTFLSKVQVGAMPDMLTFSPNGMYVLTANEGEPNTDYTVDPEGSVSVVDLSAGVPNLTDGDVTTIGFTDFNVGGPRNGELPEDVRIFGNSGAATVAEDLEPEYLTVSADSTTAWVTLQENNAVAVLDLTTMEVAGIAALGFKDHNLPGNGLDASDQDGAINIQNWPVLGMYLPDTIASYQYNGDTYLITANEGDAREYDAYDELARISNLTLDPTVFPNAAALQANTAIGRLRATTANGDTDGDTDFDELYVFGGRSFTIWGADGSLVFDSGDAFEQITAALTPALFNSQGDAGSFDTRSDDKGPEPEGVALGEIYGRTYAFIGLERIGGIMVFDVTDPTAPVFVHYAATLATHTSPEGLKFIPASESPTGRPLLVGTYEVTGSVAVFEIEAEYTLQLLHAADLEAGVEALEDAPRFSSVLNALRGEYPDQTLTLSGGDNYIPGPFLNAGADPSLASLLGSVGAGRADIVIINAMGFQAAAFGNHEFDLGPATVQSLIGASGAYPGTQFPYLSSNLDFSAESTLAGFVVSDTLPAQPNSIAASVVITVNGETIGVVGATTPDLGSLSSPGSNIVISPPDPEDWAALAAIIQPQVDALTAMGINKIILLSHLQQIDYEITLAPLLDNVDIIVAAGSHTLLADATDYLREGDVADGNYPYMGQTLSGDPVLILSTGANYRYVGRLVADFDANGVLLTDSLDDIVNGAYATDDQGVTNTGNVPANATVISVTQAISSVIAAKDGNWFGFTSEYLNGVRGSVRTEETNLGNLSADANLYVAQQYDPSVLVSIKNGGGIRAAIGDIDPATGTFIPPLGNDFKPDGAISQLDIENSLRFNNSLSLVTLTANELLQVVEHAVAATAPGSTPGQFGQFGGLAFSFDPALPANDRVMSLALKNADGQILDVIAENGELVGDPARLIRIVTLSFLADGGDNYPIDDFIASDPTRTNRVNLTEVTPPAPDAATNGDPSFAAYGTEQNAFAVYMSEVFGTIPFSQPDLPTGQDARIQNLSARSDSVLNPSPTNNLTLSYIGAYAGGVGSEIPAYDPETQRVFVSVGEDIGNGNPVGLVDILDISDPYSPTLFATLDISATQGAVPNSVAFHDGVLAVAGESAADPQANGWVLFYDADGNFLSKVQVGAMPDMLTFSPNGMYVLTANEGEPKSDYTVDPEGSVSVVDLSAGVANLTDADVTTIGFTDFNVGGPRNGELPAEVRIFGNNGTATVAEDLEPEYLTVSADSTTVWVTLQENNAVAVLDLTTMEVSGIAALGFKDHSAAGNGLDASDKDEAINIQNWPVFGMYNPDAIASFNVGGETFLVTANEGDVREWDGYDELTRIEDLPLDPTAFPNAAELQAEDALGRLRATLANGDTDNDGDYDEIYSFGARSFTVWDADGNLVWDSGDAFEQISASLVPELFNSQGDAGSFDSRSDDKGPEPEGVVLANLYARTYAFIGLERLGGIMVFDVTDPTAPIFVHFAPGLPEHVSPEGLVFIPANASPTGTPLLVVSYEVTGSVAIFEIEVSGYQLYLPVIGK
ncbi:MAG: bifunctional metallophosphatase/5'-nucleotidase [Anaerolineales bacterium]|nr:bifunctional metallophosphatase/5'-nucleotidase [Anaerolineales bacterium]